MVTWGRLLRLYIQGPAKDTGNGKWSERTWARQWAKIHHRHLPKVGLTRKRPTTTTGEAKKLRAVLSVLKYEWRWEHASKPLPGRSRTLGKGGTSTGHWWFYPSLKGASLKATSFWWQPKWWGVVHVNFSGCSPLQFPMWTPTKVWKETFTEASLALRLSPY